MCNISALVNGYKSLFARYNTYALIGRQDCSKQLLITAFLGLDEYLASFFLLRKAFKYSSSWNGPQSLGFEL